MAQYVAHARTNYFLVRDREAFEQALAPFEVEIHGQAIDERVCLLCVDSDGGGWPFTRFDEAADDYEDVDFPALVSEHLVENEVAILMEVGAEKLRYLVGVATAINSAGERRTISLEDIYGPASELGENVMAVEG